MNFQHMHRLTTLISAATIIVALPACDSGAPNTSDVSPESLVADAMAADNPLADPTAMEVRDENAIDIGDVEQALNVVGVLSDISKSENVVENIIQDGRKRVRAVNIEVNPPNPDGLWIAIRVDSTREFLERPVVLDTKILVDGELMDSFTLVLWEKANKNKFQRDVEILFGRDEIPETLLVTMESEALLLPEGTDLTVTDPYSVTEGQRTKAIANSPVRIDFTAPGPRTKPSEQAEPAETTDADPS